MPDLEQDNIELRKRLIALEGELARLRPVAEAAKRWHMANDHAHIVYSPGSTARALQDAIEALLGGEAKHE
jgi:hypothetical protein